MFFRYKNTTNFNTKMRCIGCMGEDPHQICQHTLAVLLDIVTTINVIARNRNIFLLYIYSVFLKDKSFTSLKFTHFSEYIEVIHVVSAILHIKTTEKRVINIVVF